VCGYRTGGKSARSGFLAVVRSYSLTACGGVLAPIFEGQISCPSSTPTVRTFSAPNNGGWRSVAHLINTVSRHIIDVDFWPSTYFDSLPHAELMKSLRAGSLTAARCYNLIKMVAGCASGRRHRKGGKKRTTPTKDIGRGVRRVSVSPLPW